MAPVEEDEDPPLHGWTAQARGAGPSASSLRGLPRASGRREGVELFTVALKDCVISCALIARRFRRAIAGARLLRLPDADPGRRLAVTAACRLRRAVTPGYNTKIPESIMTPNDLETRVGTFKYFDGIPTKETAEAHLQPPRLHSRGRVLPQRDARRLAGGDSPQPGGPTARRQLVPGPDLRSADGQQSAVSHRQHGHGLRQRSFST